MSSDWLADDVVSLRRLTIDDTDEWLAGEDEEQVRWFEFPRPATRQDVVRAINDWSASWEVLGSVRNWAVCDLVTGQILGGVELRDLGNATVNLSYVVFPAFRRRGIATRAALLALRYAAREMAADRAVIKALVGNEASLGVAHKLGAETSGTEPSDAGATFIVHYLDLTGWR